MKHNLQAKKNKRNITGGEIHLNQIDEADKINEDASQDYESNLLKVLDLQPEITKIFIENLTNGSFIELNEQALRRKIQMMEESRKQQIQTENVLLVLNKLIHEAVKLIDRFIFFFQGLLAGYIQNQQGNDIDACFHYFSRIEYRQRRINNILQIICQILFKSRLSFSYHNINQCIWQLVCLHSIKRLVRKDKEQLRQKVLYPINNQCSLQYIHFKIVYNIAYLLWVIGHKNIVQLSSGITQDDTNDQVQSVIDGSALYNFWTYTQIAITVLTVLGWFISVNTTESNLNYLASVEADQIFGDENRKEK
ncbi:unnamed protein product (macronuclear) [Paramecium tetraurelia]|uniref:Transmembrane protein n=1 Tax=Paramecium tetraurelia TaxID=5888 RepID=A0D8S4_PARTE|nr:uncharacterized protein GSPATT00014387001 [Paramecium tetraurelia]CAK79441.1 unnamed protein product [Paramecium tetraurelia]|eukprot:XP_001446838.1 hypothetical protein (macronuclear) [Paramecium tetraurelia strain d4-2]